MPASAQCTPINVTSKARHVATRILFTVIHASAIARSDGKYCQLLMRFCDRLIARCGLLLCRVFPTITFSKGCSCLCRCLNVELLSTRKFCGKHSHTSSFIVAPMPIDSEAVQFFGFYVALCMMCCALALIDLRRGIIPDGLNLAIAILGVAQAMIFGNLAAGVAMLGEAAAVAAIFCLLRRLYFVLRRTEGLGLGDVKFLAAATTWVGVTGIPTLLLVATLTALAAAGGLQLAGRQMKRQTSMPFGPFLALGLLLTPAFQRWLGMN